MLKYPVPAAELAITSDVSYRSIGGVSEQKGLRIWEPLGFFSKKLSPAETRYSTFDRELLDIKSVMEQFRHVVEGRTDHRSIVSATRT